MLETVTKELKKYGIYLILAIIAAIATLSFFTYLGNRYACYAAWVDSDIESKYTVRGGCLVQTKDGWVPSKNLRFSD